MLLVADTLARTLGVPPRTPRTGDPLDVLIGTILSQNTNDRNSHHAWVNLRAAFPTWEAVADAPVGDLERALRPGGMAPSKARRIQALLDVLRVERGTLSLERLRHAHTDAVLRELTRYDGIGMKTAACVCLFALQRDVFPVDTHVHRTCNRLGLVHTRTPDETFTAMRPLVPRGRAHELHTNLIRFGRRVCRAQQPQCGACPLYAHCRWPGKRAHRTRRIARGAQHDFMLLDAV